MKPIRQTAIALLLLLSATFLRASAQGAVNLSIDDLSMSEFPGSQVMVTVRDANGVPIGGLDQNDFEIVEDGRASFPPTGVTMQVNPEAVVSVVMVIDVSGSMEGKPIEEAVRAANALLDQLTSQDRAAIIAFADEVHSLDPTDLEEGKELGFTTDKNAIRNVVNFLDTKIGWDTPLYDAIYKGVKMAETEPVGKRAVVVMTDGRDERDNAQGVPVKDEGSLSTADDPINEANRFNIPVFTVGLVGLGGKIDANYLQRLAERTGGLYQQAPQPEELTPLFENVVSQLKTQYVLDYESRLQPDDTYHSLMVRVTLPQGQDFDETKFQIRQSETTASSVEGGSEPAVPEEVEAAPGPSAEGQSVAVEPSDQDTARASGAASSGVQGIIDTLRNAMEDRPVLAVVIGVGVLLLIILLIALMIVIFRGRASEETEYTGIDFTDTYAPPPPAWTPDTAEPGTPFVATEMEDRTEIAPGGWPEPAGGPPPFAPSPGVTPEGDFPAAGGTRVIERGPKHLAMLVDRARPDRRYDLKGITNVGRARDNQVVLEDSTVSRHHAWIRSEGEAFLIFDIGSGNGTFVNDEQIDEPRILENGDIIRFGDAEFVFTKVF
jgi:VWFA-related protein